MNYGYKLLLAIPLVFLFPSSCLSQGIAVDSSRVRDGRGGYQLRWDSVQGELILYRDVSDAASPAIRLYKRNGTETVISPVGQIEGAKYVDVWDAAATPDGGTVLATGVGYTPRKTKPVQLKSFLLTFGPSGNLTKAWETYPYHHLRVAVDASGNVFALGMNAGKQPYPFIVKYSPDGKVLKEFFPTSTLPKGEETILESSPTGQNRLFVANGRLFLFASQVKELYQFSLEGELINKTQLGQTLAQLATQLGSEGRPVRVMAIAPDSSGQLFAEVEVTRTSASDISHTMMVRLPPDGSKVFITNSSPTIFLGMSSAGKEIHLSYDPATKINSIAEY